MRDYATQRSTPDLTIRSPVNGRSHLRPARMDHPPSTGYWTDLVRFTVTLIGQPITPTETVGSLSRQANLTPNTRGGGHQAIKTTERLASRTPGARNSFPPTFDHYRSGNNSSASATHPLCWKDLHHAYITTRSRPWASAAAQYGHPCKHSRNVFICFLHFSLL